MAVWGTCDKHGAVTVVLVGEEVGRERALGRRSKAVRRICIAVFIGEKLSVIGILCDGEVEIILQNSEMVDHDGME